MADRITHIILYRLLGIFLAALTVASASAQTVPITIEECDTMEFSVVSRTSIPEPHYVWAIYNSSPNPVDVLDKTTQLDPALYFVDGLYASGEGSTVRVTGLPIGKYYVRINVWDEETCTDNVEMYVMEVVESLLTVELTGDSLCVDDQPAFVKIVFSGKAPYNIEYSTNDGRNYVNLTGITETEITVPIMEPLPVGEHTFWVISLENGCKAVEYTQEEDRPRTGIVIYPKPAKQPIYVKETE